MSCVNGGEALEFRAPASKSQTQRALLLAALAQGESTLRDPLDCDDSVALRGALCTMGASVVDEPHRWRVAGGALSAPQDSLWCHEAGTTSRFLAPLSLLVDGALSLNGSPRLCERPLGALLEALERLGVQVSCTGQPGALPVTLRRGPEVPQRVCIDVSRSSQYLSGLLMVAPCLPRGLVLEATGGIDRPVSRPYITMTLDAMRRFGADVHEESGRYLARPGGYRSCSFQVEGDWSAAAFLLAGGRISRRDVRLSNMNPDSTQGDRVFVDFLKQLTRPGPQRFDLTDCPDLIAPLAATAVTAKDKVEIVGVGHARIKESDRVAVLCSGLRQLGVPVEERHQSLTITPTAQIGPGELDPAGDHRMAMAFGLLSLLQPDIRVKDPECVSKSYPNFWDHLERLR